MIHPLFMRLAAQPSLFTEHALAYAELARAEAGLLGQRWLRRGVLAALGLGSAALSLGLAGVAALLAAALPCQRHGRCGRCPLPRPCWRRLAPCWPAAHRQTLRSRCCDGRSNRMPCSFTKWMQHEQHP